jgi:hypothetical protein
MQLCFAKKIKCCPPSPHVCACVRACVRLCVCVCMCARACVCVLFISLLNWSCFVAGLALLLFFNSLKLFDALKWSVLVEFIFCVTLSCTVYGDIRDIGDRRSKVFTAHNVSA